MNRRRFRHTFGKSNARARASAPDAIPAQPGDVAENSESLVRVSFRVAVWDKSWPTSTRAGRSSLSRERTSCAFASSCRIEPFNDSRVAYWEPTKWVARIRAMRTDANPLLLKMNMGAGHGGASGRYERLHEQAFRYAFIVDQVRMGLTQ